MTLPLLSEAFSDSSVGKESACNAGDLSSIPGSGRSAGEGMGYPLQYVWASLVAQVVKRLPTVRETWVRSRSPEDQDLVFESGRSSVEKEMTTHSSTLAWKIPWTEEHCRL